MDNQEHNGKFIYEPDQLIVKISQCKNCSNKKQNTSCAFYDQIPLGILTNKIKCDNQKLGAEIRLNK